MNLKSLNEAFEAKYHLNEELFEEDALDEDIKYQQEIKDNKTGDVVTLSGDNQIDLNNKVRKFKSTHGGNDRYKDIATQRQNGQMVQDREEVTAEVDDDEINR